MAITTYAELQSAIGDWLAKSNLTARAPDFIALAEVEINDLLRTADMETRATASTVAGEAYLAVPENFAGARRMIVEGTTARPLESVTPQYIDRRYLDAARGQPRVYAVEDNQFRFGPTPDTAYTLEVSYFRKVPALSDVNATNWLLSSHPSVYLFGALKEAAPFLMDDARIQIWETKFQSALSRLQIADRFDRFPGPYAMKHDYGTDDRRP